MNINFKKVNNTKSESERRRARKKLPKVLPLKKEIKVKLHEIQDDS